MLSIEEVQDLLDEIAEELPSEFFKELNGGILLLPRAKRSPQAIDNDLYVLGEYCHSFSMGRYINIYYGSFEAIFSYASHARIKAELRETLLHEFTHHVESLAGEKGLEIKDAQELKKYRDSHRK